MYYDCEENDYKNKYIERGYASLKEVSINIEGSNGVSQEINDKFSNLKTIFKLQQHKQWYDGESSDNQGSHISKEFSSQDPNAPPSVEGSTFNI